MENDVAQSKKWHQMVTLQTATRHTRVHVHECVNVRVCARVRMCVCACMSLRREHHVKGFSYPLNHVHIIYASDYFFFYVGLCFFF